LIFTFLGFLRLIRNDGRRAVTRLNLRPAKAEEPAPR
jgi:hypothetical protein